MTSALWRVRPAPPQPSQTIIPNINAPEQKTRREAGDLVRPPTVPCHARPLADPDFMTTHSLGLRRSPDRFQLLELPPELVALLERAEAEARRDERDPLTGDALRPSQFYPVGPPATERGRYPVLVIKSGCPDLSAKYSGASAGPMFASLCSAHSTYQLRQVQTSNSVFVGQVAPPTRRGGAAAVDSHISLLGKCSHTFELVRSSYSSSLISREVSDGVAADYGTFPPPVPHRPGKDEDAIDFIKTTFPDWNPDPAGDDSHDDNHGDNHDRSASSVFIPVTYFDDIPYSEMECQTATTLLLSFLAPPPAASSSSPSSSAPRPPKQPTPVLHNPSPREQLRVWDLLLAAALVEQIDLAGPSGSSWARAPPADSFDRLFAAARSGGPLPPLPLYAALLTRLRVPLDRFACFAPYLPALHAGRARLGPADTGAGALDCLTTASYVGLLLLYVLTACPASSSSSTSSTSSSHTNTAGSFRNEGVPVAEFTDRWAALLPTKWHALTRLVGDGTAGAPPGPVPLLLAPFCFPVRAGQPARLMFRAWPDTPWDASGAEAAEARPDQRLLLAKHMFPHRPSCPAGLAEKGGASQGGSAAKGGANAKRKWHEILTRDRR